MLGLRHVALRVDAARYAETRRFYTAALGMRVVWEPDADSVYLSSGADNLALHRTPGADPDSGALDHIGMAVPAPEHVDRWHAFLSARNADILGPPKDHRDGTRSFYCRDPAGAMVQFIHMPATALAISDVEAATDAST